MSYMPAELDDDDIGDGFFDSAPDSDRVEMEDVMPLQQQSRIFNHGNGNNHDQQQQAFSQAPNNAPKMGTPKMPDIKRNGQSFHLKTNSSRESGNKSVTQTETLWKSPSSTLSSPCPSFRPSSYSYAVPSSSTILTEEDLKIATVKGNVKTVQKCLQQGLSINEVLPNGWTPLMYACNHSKSCVVELLLKEGADPSYHVDMYTPLMCVCSTSAMGPERLLCVQMLIQAGADVNARDRHHSTGLMLASRLGYLDLVEYLIERGAKVNEQDSRGWTALTWSVQRGHKDVAMALLEAGADCSIKHADRLTVRDMAAHMPTDEMLALLERRPVISSSGGGDMTGIGIEGGGALKKDPGLLSSHSVLGDRDSGARSTDLRYGEMEIFLLGLDLPHLMPLFQSHLIDLYLLLDMTEQDLINAGVEQVGARKKILDASQAIHKKNWEGSSLVSVHFNKQICCSDAMAMVANVSKHIRYINSTVSYIRQHLKHHPQSVIHATDRASPTQLVRHVADTTKHVQMLQEELCLLQKDLSREMKTVNADPPDLIPEKAWSIRGSRVVKCGFIVMVAAGLGYVWRNSQFTDNLYALGDKWRTLL